MARSYRVPHAPPNEKQVRAKTAARITHFIGNEFDGVGSAVLSLEGSGTCMHRTISTNGVGVASIVIGGKESAHAGRGGGSTSAAHHLLDDVARHERDVRRPLGQASHEVRIPLRTEWDVATHAPAFVHDLLLQVATYAVQHLELELFGLDVVLASKCLDGLDNCLI